jgi:hypothetical protein
MHQVHLESVGSLTLIRRHSGTEADFTPQKDLQVSGLCDTGFEPSLAVESGKLLSLPQGSKIGPC